MAGELPEEAGEGGHSRGGDGACWGVPALTAVGGQGAVGLLQRLGGCVLPTPARPLSPWLWGAGIGKEGQIALVVILQAWKLPWASTCFV